MALAILAGGCSSPNRGEWQGSFDGDVSGVVNFRINARGTQIKGSMVGKTRQEQDFRAAIEGILRQDYIDATFEGSASANGLPVAFDGTMKGSLQDAAGEGQWQALLEIPQTRLRGTWSVSRVDDRRLEETE